MESAFLAQMRRHRAEAVVGRDRLDARIKALDVLIGQETGNAVPSSPQPADAQATRHSPGSLPGAVSDALTARGGGPLNFPTLLALVTETLGEVNEKSLRGTLPRMEREGKLVKPRRGEYALPTNAEDPAVGAGSSDLFALAEKGGGGSDGEGLPDDAVGAYDAESHAHESEPNRGAAVMAVP